MKKRSSILLPLLFIAFPAFGQVDNSSVSQKTPEVQKKQFQLFESNDILDISVRFDLNSYMRKKLNGGSLDGVLRIESGVNDSIVKKVKIKNRGIFRLNYCSFPPMELILKKPLYEYGDSGMIKKLKLVTNCHAGDIYKDYVFKEYLMYRMFNLFTDTSFKVRLVRVTFLDTRGRKPLKRYAFLIEPADVLAERINSFTIKRTSLTQKMILSDLMDRIAIFNYMTGNYDWAVPNQHNIAILRSRNFIADPLAIAIPYDFDWSGFVNPLYAVPTEEMGIATVKERLFTGICRSRDRFRDDLLKFIPLKKQIYELINKFPYLDRRAKKDLTDYLDEFYKQLQTPHQLEMLIDLMETTCKHL